MYRINVDSWQSVGVTPRTNNLINIDAGRRSSDRPLLNVSNITEHGDIIVCHNVLSREQCDRIIMGTEFLARQHLNPELWDKALTVGEANSNEASSDSPRQNKILSVRNDVSNMRVLDNLLWHTYHVARETVSSTILQPNGFNLVRDEGYSVLRYEASNYYKEHTDYNDNLVRVLTGLIYLNDDFDGGEVHFRRQNFTYKPTAGSIVLFPSVWSHPHTAMPVTNGVRYNVITWWR